MKNRRQLNFWQVSFFFPPILVRLLARIPRSRPLTDLEIATRSGLTVDRIFILQHLTSWVGVDMLEMRAFLTGCRIDFCDYEQINRAKVYMWSKGKPPTFKFLRVAPEWKTKYEPLLIRWRQSIKQQTK